jgi:hypothetical protein
MPTQVNSPPVQVTLAQPGDDESLLKLLAFVRKNGTASERTIDCLRDAIKEDVVLLASADDTLVGVFIGRPVKEPDSGLVCQIERLELVSANKFVRASLETAARDLTWSRGCAYVVDELLVDREV